MSRLAANAQRPAARQTKKSEAETEVGRRRGTPGVGKQRVQDRGRWRWCGARWRCNATGGAGQRRRIRRHPSCPHLPAVARPNVRPSVASLVGTSRQRHGRSVTLSKACHVACCRSPERYVRHENTRATPCRLPPKRPSDAQACAVARRHGRVPNVEFTREGGRLNRPATPFAAPRNALPTATAHAEKGVGKRRSAAYVPNRKREPGSEEKAPGQGAAGRVVQCGNGVGMPENTLVHKGPQPSFCRFFTLRQQAARQRPVRRCAHMVREPATSCLQAGTILAEQLTRVPGGHSRIALPTARPEGQEQYGKQAKQCPRSAGQRY